MKGNQGAENCTDASVGGTLSSVMLADQLLSPGRKWLSQIPHSSADGARQRGKGLANIEFTHTRVRLSFLLSENSKARFHFTNSSKLDWSRKTLSPSMAAS